MENWEFLLQRKGDKSWLPLESPTVEILEGQYRLAARSDGANQLVAIAIVYRPLADVRHQPIQQKIAKRISHDGLLIVMPYTNFVPGLWQIECDINCDIECDRADESTSENLASKKTVKTVKFDVIPISSEAGSEWQYSEPEDEIPTSMHTNALGIDQTEPSPLSYSSPILDIAEQRSTELVQSMFDDFFDDEPSDQSDQVLSAQVDIDSAIFASASTASKAFATALNTPLPRVLLRLQQPQYLINEDNSFMLTGEAYTNGEIEVTLKDPQTLDVIVNVRYVAIGAVPFAYQVSVPPPSEIQVLIGEVKIYPQQDFQQDDDLLIRQQAIAVSYPASRVLPELIKEAQQYDSQNNSQNNSPITKESINDSSYPQSPQSYPQVANQTEALSLDRSPVSKPANLPSLPSLPSNPPKSSEKESTAAQSSAKPLSLPPLPPFVNKAFNPPSSPPISKISQPSPESFPQVEANHFLQIEPEFALTDSLDQVDNQADRQNLLTSNEDESELLYSFEEELPKNYEELLEQPRLEQSRLQISKIVNNRFLSKLQTLSSEAIATQKASQRNDELLLDTFPPSDPLQSPEDFAAGTTIDLDNLDQLPRPIAEVARLNALDLELDVELDRLLAPDMLILNEYVWEEAIDPNTFPVRTVSNSNAIASTLSETAQTIRNIQESSPQALSEQEPVPIPEIIVAAGEIISGTPMVVTVRLPAIAPKFFVKFWIKDLQTRMIVDGPRWLLDFSVVPDTNMIETRTNISIPLSSVDVAFEAIAIEAQTQRESHKVRVTRAVAPPNLAYE